MNKLFPRFIFFLLMCLTFSLAATAQGVDIPDPKLRTAIETALGKASGAAITADEMATLKELNARDASISDLTGLEFATNLITLRLHNNHITNISPLASLTELRGLYLDYNDIADISPLSGLIQLGALGLGGNNISDIAALAGLTHLTRLRLNHNRISDISTLSRLTQLTELRLDRNNITDLSPLVANTGLGSGDEINVKGNPLNYTSINTHIPALQSKGIAVEISDTTNLNVDEPRTVELDNTKNLNVGEPHTVRLIYFLPNDRSPQQDIDTKIDTLIREVQQFYADEMERHGFGRKTFTFETDVNGKTVVHHVDGQFTDSYYRQDTAAKVREEIQQQFYAPHRIYAVMIDISNERVSITSCGEAKARPVDKIDTMFVMPASGKCFNTFKVAAHEFGHTFGLRHDLRNNAYILSYAQREIQDRISKCAAEWLDVHRFFNPSQTLFNAHTKIQMLPPLAYSPKAIRLRFEVTDPDGLHQAQLVIPTIAEDPGRDPQLHGCKRLNGESNTIEFITTELIVETATEIALHVIDIYGNITSRRIAFTRADILPDQNDRTPTTLGKISDDNQQGLSSTSLPNPLVVKVTDQNGIALEEVVVTFAVTTGGGTLSTTRTITDENGRAQSTLTLGPNLGTNTIEVSAAGIEQTVIFNAVAEAAVDIPDPNLRATIETVLSKTEGEPIAPVEMVTLPHLEAKNANISVLTGLEHATKMTGLNLSENNISDLSPVAGLAQLIKLSLWANSISDISPVKALTNLTELNFSGNSISSISAIAGLTQLKWLHLQSNRISNLAPLAGLTNLMALRLDRNFISDISVLSNLPQLKELRLDRNGITDISPLVANTGLGSGDEINVKGNPLSYQSIHTHIPTLQSRGVTVEFDHSDTESPPIRADVNSDGSVNVLDLVVVASELGNAGTNIAVDVNGDGAVNILDLILVAGMFDSAAAAPSAQPQVPETLTAVEVQGWLTDARALEVKDPITKRGFLMLEQLLVSLIPKETDLLANYPNPFNPETWIPYRLAEDAFVTLTIYDTAGRVVRTLDLGHRIASAYENRSEAIYWDGKNNLGKQVASGVYFYQLRIENSRSETEAGDYAATRKMVILK